MTAPPNPLIAERLDTTPFYAGVTLVEGIVEVKGGIEAGSWIDTSIGAGFVVVDAALLVMDPLGSMTSWVAAMCMEHVRPLTDVLDWLAGDPDQLAANAQTWANVAANTMRSADDVRDAILREVPQWAGPAADTYRRAAEVEVLALRGYAESADAKAVAVEMSGRIVLIVRTMVRDLIADLISVLLVRGPMWTAEEALSVGLATPWVAGQISALCAKWAFRIARLLDALIESLGRLTALIRGVDEYTAAIRSRPRVMDHGSEGLYPGHVPDPELDGRPHADRTAEIEPSPWVGGPEVFDPQQLRALTPDDVRSRIPDDWDVRPSARGGGTVYSDPAHRGRQIRIMPGYPAGSRPDPVTWGPYVEVSQNGVTTKVPLIGNPTLESP